MQAITTRFHGPTNTRDARIIASAAAGRLTVPYPYEMNISTAHALAAMKLCAHLKWSGSVTSGQMRNGDYAHVITAV